ncbi:AraC family transcriptional regulator [Chitinophaga horti]|uniref:AraC family transcriptional regulator n=1 Tax=Chitinophaga horti TaxID=2920382 RepID=A0ABY6J4I6_9BACT|nr:AraC family transcriptional regulator [Chitinophaga horti]UYQ94513.1 AraC family transcriptional regulator [Chitinophaga horti]
MAEVIFEDKLTFEDLWIYSYTPSGEKHPDKSLPVHLADGCLKHWTLEDGIDVIYNCGVKQYHTFTDPPSSAYCLYFDLSESRDATGIYRVYYGMSGSIASLAPHSLQLIIGPAVFGHYFTNSNDSSHEMAGLKKMLQPSGFRGMMSINLRMLQALMKIPLLALQETADLHKLRSCTYELLSLFINELIDPAPIFSNRSLSGACRLIEVNDAIAANTDEDVPPLEEAARRACMCLTKFKKLFRVIYHTTYHKYHQRIRLLKAKEMFRLANMNITTIVHDLGYRNAGHFARLFKECFNISPKEYQRQFEGLV